MKWRQERGISRKLFAQLADCSERKLATYEKTQVLPKSVQRPVTETVRLIKALRDLAGDDQALKDWLTTPNRAFGKHTPLALIEAGEADILWQMIHQLRQGEFA
jgi:uncharacterized protein (DUF2384 family)